MVFGVVISAMVMTAVTFMVIFMAVAVCFRTEFKLSFSKSLGCSISRTCNACTESDSCFGKCHLGTHSDSPADKDIGLGFIEETCQSTMTRTIGINDLLADDFTILDIVELELLSVSEMLEDFSVLVSYCDSHC